MTDAESLSGFYRPGDGGEARPVDALAIVPALADTRGLLWVDLLIRSDEDGRVLDDVFHFHPLTIEDSTSPRVDPAKVDDHGDYLFIVVQALTEYQEHEELESVEVDFYLGTNYVVSCHRQPVPAIDAFKERCRRDGYILTHSADWLLHGLLDALVDEYLPIVDAVDDTIDELEVKVLHRAHPQQLQQILIVKRNALRLRRAT